MTPWILFGAGQGCGLALAQRAAGERPLYALVRRAEQAQRLRDLGVQVILGDARDEALLATLFRQAGAKSAILSTLGGGGCDYSAHRAMIDQGVAQGIQRMLLVTSLGCGDSWPLLSPAARAAFGQAVREKSLAESWLQSSGMHYCILRPGGLLTGEASGQAQLYATPRRGLVRRADVAQWMYHLMAQPQAWNQIHTLIDPHLQATERHTA
ncbi:NAD(P)H-binding protein [Edwardsiella tarda]|uniref:NAD(P)H-binding protein n=1 Tax=Edwardsiella tarda TaxID=636 RepID=UPI003A84AEE2